ncbi:unnamed protein product [Phytomonas sp. EM1]|nr:unnamed protein product [Phytomonas sp. EM1]|eukprot:CCW65691.1 unnamed protein product [Phytomonas sp. isolate EM1]
MGRLCKRQECTTHGDRGHLTSAVRAERPRLDLRAQLRVPTTGQAVQLIHLHRVLHTTQPLWTQQRAPQGRALCVRQRPPRPLRQQHLPAVTNRLRSRSHVRCITVVVEAFRHHIVADVR